jgi:ATP-dependent exoDNAse (exonuclease V) beta subunit
MEGVLYDDISPKELQDMLHQALSNEQVRSWFSPKWEVHNECAILFRDPESDTVVERRPDRVISDANEIIVVDFKFGKPHKEHQTQVKLYMEKLHEMDPRPVKGYLWYVTQQKVEEV